MRTFLAALSLLGLTCPSHAQRAQRDPQAVVILGAAHAALGSPPGLDQTHSVVTRGQLEPTDKGRASGTFVWKVAGSEIRREVILGDKASVFVSGRGNPSSTREGRAKQIANHVSLANPPYHLPGALLAGYLKDQRFSVGFADKEDSASPQTVCIRVVRDDGPESVARAVTPQEWCFDKTSSLPVNVRYRLPDNSDAANYSEALIEFSDYRPVAGVLFPYLMKFHEDGQAAVLIRVLTVAPNERVAPSEFDSSIGDSR